MTREIWLIADDYGLSPGVSASIRELIVQDRLSGTGCMTLFPEWPTEAQHLHDLPPHSAIGLHLTLTDQMAVTGPSALTRDGRLPSLSTLARMTMLNAAAARAAMTELDKQYERFTDAMGRTPDFIDGHQHVHFLPVARRWLTQRFSGRPPAGLPFVRGSASFRYAPSGTVVKAAVVQALGLGYDACLTRHGIPAVGPLAGFYKWDDREGFASMISDCLRNLPDNAIIMCHPGHPDAVLASRDRLTAPRAVEHAFLSSHAFADALRAADVELARMSR